MWGFSEKSRWSEGGIVPMCYKDFVPVANVLIEKVGNDLVGDE